MRKIISYVSLFSMMNRNSMLGLGSAVRAFLLPCQFALQSLDIAVCFAHVLFLAMGEIIGLFARALLHKSAIGQGIPNPK